MDADLLERIQRLDVAIHQTRTDLRKVPPWSYILPRRRLSDAEISDALHSLIHNVASFHDHLQKWGDRHGVSRESIHNYLKDSFDFCVVRDLWNNDKHGYPPHNGGWTRKAPRMLHPNSICRLKTLPKKGSSVTMSIGPKGPVIGGDGSAHIVFTAEVIDKHNAKLGDADDFIDRAVHHCEAALLRFGVVPRSPDS